MSASTLNANGLLRLGGKPTFPIVLSNGPPSGGTAPSGRPALAEVANAGVTMVRTGIQDWALPQIDAQLAAERTKLDAAGVHGLFVWLWLGDAPNLPAVPASAPPPVQQLILDRITQAFKTHPALGAYKGYDEPRNPNQGKDWIRPDGLIRAYEHLQQTDPAHAVVITQAPLSTVAQLTPYRPAFDITGADIYPVSYPPGVHAGASGGDISLVGDVTAKMRQAAGDKPIWMTLQIAWSGMAPSKTKPGIVPRFPSLHDERFMTYQAIIDGAQGLAYFGGHLTQVMSPADAKMGWNWTFWEQSLRPVIAELSSTAIQPALLAPDLKPGVKASASDVEVATRAAGRFLYVIAARRSSTATSLVTLGGLPAKNDGTAIRGGQVLFEYVQDPPPPPVKPRQIFRSVGVTDGRFRDWFGPHDVHVYRFAR